jgi:hypothetical protein
MTHHADNVIDRQLCAVADVDADVRLRPGYR